MFALRRRDYPVEALLRPPIEFYPAFTAYMLAALALWMPGVIMMTPSVAMTTAIVLFIMGSVRLKQGLEIYRYHNNLLNLPYYGLRPDQIPVSNRYLFLGRGFKWDQRHTQRLVDSREPRYQQYITPGALARAARSLERKLDKQTKSDGTNPYEPVLKLLNSREWWNPVAPPPPVGGNPVIHAVGMPEGEKDVLLPLGERVGHTLVMGTTRVGKTRLAEILITQDIRRGDVTIVMDPKGDADLMLRCKIEAARAGRPFYMFHLGFPEISARYNGIGNFSKITEPAGRLTEPLPSDGNSAAFKEFAWRFANIIIQADVALGNKPSYERVRQYINNIEPLLLKYAKKTLNKNGPDGWEKSLQIVKSNIDVKSLSFALKDKSLDAIALLRYVEETEFYDPVLDGLLSAFKYDRSYFDKIVSSLGPLLEKLTTGSVSELIAPDYNNLDDSRPIFDWMTVIRQKAVVYVGFDALSDSTVASATGASMLADLTSVSGFIYKHGIDFGLPAIAKKPQLPKIALHADEFNELIGDQFIPMLNKAGGSGFQVTAYTQTASDILAKLGSDAKSGQVQGNFNNLIMLRVKEPKTAEILTDQLPQVQVTEVTSVTGASDSSDPHSKVDFSSTNQDRQTKGKEDMIGVHDIIKLPKGQAFALIEGGQLWKIRMPLPEAENDPIFQQDFKDAYDEMKRRYKTGEDIISKKDNLWLQMMHDIDTLDKAA